MKGITLYEVVLISSIVSFIQGQQGQTPDTGIKGLYKVLYNQNYYEKKMTKLA